jgi:hypothetical protein
MPRCRMTSSVLHPIDPVDPRIATRLFIETVNCSPICDGEKCRGITLTAQGNRM